MAEQPEAFEQRRGHRLELIAVMLASVTSLLALFVSGYATYWQRQQARAQIYPLLEMSFGNGPHFHCNLANNGMGPALIKTVDLRLGGKVMTAWGPFTRALMEKRPWSDGGTQPPGLYVEDLRHTVVRPQADLTVLRVEDASPLDGDDIGGLLKDMYLSICYCSVLDECWRRVAQSGQPAELQPVSSCEHEPNTLRGSFEPGN